MKTGWKKGSSHLLDTMPKSLTFIITFNLHNNHINKVGQIIMLIL